MCFLILLERCDLALKRMVDRAFFVVRESFLLLWDGIVVLGLMCLDDKYDEGA